MPDCDERHTTCTNYNTIEINYKILVTYIMKYLIIITILFIIYFKYIVFLKYFIEININIYIKIVLICIRLIEECAYEKYVRYKELF